jgi:two-component sensor histidine kinase
MESGGNNGVDIFVEACPLDVGVDFGVPLGLLVTELVTNSLKHAFPDGRGTISIILRNESNRDLTLIVSDDGIGKAGAGVTDGVRSGLGTRIISRLVEQLEGTMIVQDGNGTTTEIRIPMPVLA